MSRLNLGKVTGKYRLPVLVGNWYEENCLEQDKMRDYLWKRDNNQLLSQKGLYLYEDASEKACLSISSDGLVRYGDTVMLLNKGTEDKMQHSAEIQPRNSSVLAVTVTPTQMLAAQSDSSGPSGVSGCKTISSSTRTAFIIESASGKRRGEPLKYGEFFYVTTVPSHDETKMYLHSEPILATAQARAKKSKHQNVTLVADASKYCEWVAISFDPQWRLELEGTPVPANEKLIITHRITMQNLALEEKYMVSTLFGNEYEITAHTYMNAHKAEMEVNHWEFCLRGKGCSAEDTGENREAGAMSHATDNDTMQQQQPEGTCEHDENTVLIPDASEMMNTDAPL